MMIDEENPVVEFNAHDRCDGCGAQAYTCARHPEHSELLFCVHHTKAHQEQLMDEGWTVISDYEALARLAGEPEPVTV